MAEKVGRRAKQVRSGTWESDLNYVSPENLTRMHTEETAQEVQVVVKKDSVVEQGAKMPWETKPHDFVK